MGLHCYRSRRHAEYLMIGLARLDRRGESGFRASGAGSERPHPVPGGRPGGKVDSSTLHFFVVDGEVGLEWESDGLQGVSRVQPPNGWKSRRSRSDGVRSEGGELLLRLEVGVALRFGDDGAEWNSSPSP